MHGNHRQIPTSPFFYKASRAPAQGPQLLLHTIEAANKVCPLRGLCSGTYLGYCIVVRGREYFDMAHRVGGLGFKGGLKL